MDGPQRVVGHLDTPSRTAQIPRSHVLVQGWALVGTQPAESVAISANGVLVGTVRVGLPRPDIALGFGDSKLERAGFELVIDLSNYTTDQVTLSALTLASSGGEHSFEPVLFDEFTLKFERRSQDVVSRPYTDDELRSLAAEWWYYSVELAPGVVSRSYVDAFDTPLLPRIMMRRVNLVGMDCLDLGSVEGLIPVLMCRGGARSVLSTDFDSWCMSKMEAVKHAYGVDFEFQPVGLMYNLFRQFRTRSFDFINCSGLLYHTWSPMTVLAAVRPLLRRNGLMMITTHVLLDDGYLMEFNAGGRLQDECNTFWYISADTLEYILRYLRLTPIDVIHWRHSDFPGEAPYPARHPRRTYASILCRATDVAEGDEWMRASALGSVEYKNNSDWNMADLQRESAIDLVGASRRIQISLAEVLQGASSVASTVPKGDSHFLRLSDRV